MVRWGQGHRSAWCPQGHRGGEGEEAFVREGAWGGGSHPHASLERSEEGFRQQVVLGPGLQERRRAALGRGYGLTLGGVFWVRMRAGMCPLRPRLPSRTPCSHLCVSLSVCWSLSGLSRLGACPAEGTGTREVAGGGGRGPLPMTSAEPVTQGAGHCLGAGGSAQAAPCGMDRHPIPSLAPSQPDTAPWGDSGGPQAPFQRVQTVSAPPPSGLRDRSLVHPQPARPRARPAHINPGGPCSARPCAHSPGLGHSSCAFHVVLCSAVPLAAGQAHRAGPWGRLALGPRSGRLLCLPAGLGAVTRRGGRLLCPGWGGPRSLATLEKGPRAEGCPGWGSPTSPG